MASVNGLAYGGGLALSLACDLRFAAQSASFCAAFIRTGLTGTDIGISYFLPRLIGASRAFDLMVTGRAVEAQEALQMGIVSQVFSDEDIADQTLEVARLVAGYTSVGLRMTKEAMWANLDASPLKQYVVVHAWPFWSTMPETVGWTRVPVHSPRWSPPCGRAHSCQPLRRAPLLPCRRPRDV